MLNPNQEKAVNHREGSALVLAGAGSGKTRVLITRIAKLLEEKVLPSNILATTFTNKAVNEIQKRANLATNNLAEGIWLGTFHSIAIRILRKSLEIAEEDEINFGVKEANLAWSKAFTIYDQNDSSSLFSEIAKRVCKDCNYEDIKLWKGIVAEMRNSAYGLIPQEKEYPPVCQELFWQTLEEYSLNNSLGYDEILWICAALLKNEPVSQALTQIQFRHILIDECQDLNKIQHYLTHLIFFGEEDPKTHDYTGMTMYGESKSRSLFLVGDIDQAIYSWRGACPELIVKFPEQYNATIYRIEENYRSIPSIVDTANRLIEYNQFRLEKKLIATRENSERQINLSWEWDDIREAQQVATKIKSIAQKNESEKANEKFNWNNIAILYRTNAQSKLFESALTKEGIPYRVLDGLKFFDRKEVKDVLTYLRLSLNTDDSIGIERTINTPRRGIGGVSLGKMKKLAELRKQPLWDIISDISNLSGILKGRALSSLKDYIATIEELKGLELSKDTVKTICKKVGYYQYLNSIEDKGEQDSRLRNLEELQDLIDEYMENNPDASISKFLEIATLNTKNQDDDEEKPEAVNLLTIHSAKGLEFPIVFLVGLENGVLPSFRSNTPEEIEEERRLCYVGITRAQDSLFLSGAESRNGKQQSMSRFINEMKKK